MMHKLSAPIDSNRDGHPGRGSQDNHVELLIDGRQYFARWFDELEALTESSAQHRELRHTAWRLNDVGPKGRYSGENERLISALRQAKAAGVRITVRLSGHAGGIANGAMYRKLRCAGIPVYLDRRLRSISASQHEKFSVFRDADRVTALTGSIDLSRTRWDTRTHSVVSTSRYPFLRPPSHDTGVAITGSAALHIAAVFDDSVAGHTIADRHCFPTCPSPSPDRDTGIGSTVYVLRTTPLDPLRTNGTREYSVAAAYLDAIDASQQYIYVEDQYFWPLFDNTPAALQGDILTSLLKALRRGVDVYAVIPAPRTRTPVGRLEAAQRHNAMSILTKTQSASTGQVHFATPVRDTHPVFVHSKLLICDDEYVQIGSSNVNARSMFHDGELAVGIADRHVATEFRARLWEEHLGLPRDALRDYPAAAAHFKAALRAGMGNIRTYRSPVTRTKITPVDSWLWNHVINPKTQPL